MYGLSGMLGLLSSAGHLAAVTIGSPGDAIAAIAWTNKGCVLGQLGESDQAIECYDKLLEINPTLAKKSPTRNQNINDKHIHHYAPKVTNTDALPAFPPMRSA